MDFIADGPAEPRVVKAKMLRSGSLVVTPRQCGTGITTMMNRSFLALSIWAVCCVPSLAADPPVSDGTPQILMPGFTVRELPIDLTSLNNIEYAADGRLFAGGYDGRFHLLRDTNGDGLEDKVDTFWPETGANYPLGVTVKDGEPYFVLKDEIVRFRDSDGDQVPDKRETVIKDLDDPELAKADYLHHRRVDGAMAIAPSHYPRFRMFVFGAIAHANSVLGLV